MSDIETRLTLRLPLDLRDRMTEAAANSGRSMNAEILSRLSFSLQAHPHAYLLRALLDVHEKLLAGKEELEIPPHLQDEVRDRADRHGVSPQKFLVRLVLEAINELDEQTELGKEFERRILDLEAASDDWEGGA